MAAAPTDTAATKAIEKEYKQKMAVLQHAIDDQ